MIRHDVNQPDRRRMLELAAALDWPRVQLERLTTNPSRTRDNVGPGVMPWYALAEQMPAEVVADATRGLARAEAAAASPEPASTQTEPAAATKSPELFSEAA